MHFEYFSMVFVKRKEMFQFTCKWVVLYTAKSRYNGFEINIDPDLSRAAFSYLLIIKLLKSHSFSMEVTCIREYMRMYKPQHFSIPF